MLTLFKHHQHINWAIVDQAMVSGVNFLTGILFARFLGLEEYGRFTLAWMAVLFFNSFQQAGIIAPMMSIGPKHEVDMEAEYYSAVFIHQLIWSTGSAVLLWIGILLSGIVKPDWHIQNLAFPLAATLFVWQLQDFIRRYFFVRRKSGLAFLNDTVSYLGQILLLVILFQLTELNAARVLWIITGTSMLAVFLGLFKIKQITSPSRVLTTVTKKHWHFSKWMLASASMQWFSGNFFFVAVGVILGPIALGAIKAAQNIIGVTHIFFQAMENFAPSQASRAFYSGGAKSLVFYLRNLTFFGIFATSFIAAVVWCFPGFLLNFFYEAEYTQYVYILRWFCIIYIFTFLPFPFVIGLRAIEKTAPYFNSSLYMGILSLIAAYPSVNAWGITGAMSGVLVIKVLSSGYLFVSLNSYLKKVA